MSRLASAVLKKAKGAEPSVENSAPVQDLEKVLAERHSIMGRIGELRQVMNGMAREAREKGANFSRSIGRNDQPGSPGAKRKEFEDRVRSLQSEIDGLEAQAAELQKTVDEKRRVASLAVCESLAPEQRELCRKALRTAIDASLLFEQAKQTLVDVGQRRGLSVCGPLMYLAAFDMLGRPDVHGTPLSMALADAHRCGIIQAGEKEFAFNDGVSQHPVDRALSDAETQRAAETLRSATAEMVGRAIRPIRQLIGRPVIGADGSHGAAAAAEKQPERVPIANRRPRPTRDEDDSDADGGDDPVVPMGEVSKTPVIAI